jgi:hypothetical protein
LLDNGFTWPRPSSISTVTRRLTRRRQQPPFARSPSLEVSAPNCNRRRPLIAAQKTSSFSHLTATQFAPGFSVDGSGFLPSKMQDCHRSEFTTFAARRSRFGSPKGPIPSKSPSSQATPRRPWCSIATATFTRTRTTASSRPSNGASSRSAPEASATGHRRSGRTELSTTSLRALRGRPTRTDPVIPCAALRPLSVRPLVGGRGCLTVHGCACLVVKRLCPDFLIGAGRTASCW